MKLFTITDSGGVVHDYTSNIVVPTYEVNRQDIYENWTDGNGIDHREIYRGRISGSFSMLFQTFDEYLSFVNVLNGVKAAGGYYPAAFYLNNKNEIGTCNAYIEFSPVLNPKGFGNLEELPVNIAER